MKTKFNRIMLKLLAVLSIVNIFAVYSCVYATEYSWYLKFDKPNTPPGHVDISAISDKESLIFREPTEKTGTKNIYLTFDVGYDDGNVGKILDALKKHNAPGAFFVLPHFIEGSPALIMRMINEGHLICNHSTHHKNMATVTDTNEFAAELAGVENLFRQRTGKEMAKFFRPPEGRFSEDTVRLARENGYRTVFWSLAYADWDKNNQPDPRKAIGLLLSRVHDGCVMLLHPTSATNAAIMDELLSELENRGYTFASLAAFPSENDVSHTSDVEGIEENDGVSDKNPVDGIKKGGE